MFDQTQYYLDGNRSNLYYTGLSYPAASFRAMNASIVYPTVDISNPWGASHIEYDILATFHHFGGRILSRAKVVGPYLSKINIFGVEFRANIKFLGSFLRKHTFQYQFSGIWENSNFGDKSSRFLSRTYLIYYSKA